MPQEHFMPTVGALPGPGDAFPLSDHSRLTSPLEGEFKRPCWSCGREGKDHPSLTEAEGLWGMFFSGVRGFGMVEVWLEVPNSKIRTDNRLL